MFSKEPTRQGKLATFCSCYLLSLLEVRPQSPSAATASVQASGRGVSGGALTRLSLSGICTGAAAAAARYGEVDGFAAACAEGTRLVAARIVVCGSAAMGPAAAPGAPAT